MSPASALVVFSLVLAQSGAQGSDTTSLLQESLRINDLEGQVQLKKATPVNDEATALKALNEMPRFSSVVRTATGSSNNQEALAFLKTLVNHPKALAMLPTISQFTNGHLLDVGKGIQTQYGHIEWNLTHAQNKAEVVAIAQKFLADYITMLSNEGALVQSWFAAAMDQSRELLPTNQGQALRDNMNKVFPSMKETFLAHGVLETYVPQQGQSPAMFCNAMDDLMAHIRDYLARIASVNVELDAAPWQLLGVIEGVGEEKNVNMAEPAIIDLVKSLRNFGGTTKTAFEVNAKVLCENVQARLECSVKNCQASP